MFSTAFPWSAANGDPDSTWTLVALGVIVGVVVGFLLGMSVGRFLIERRVTRKLRLIETLADRAARRR